MLVMSARAQSSVQSCFSPQDIVEEDEDAFAKGKKNVVPAMSEAQAEAKKAVSTL